MAKKVSGFAFVIFLAAVFIACSEKKTSQETSPTVVAAPTAANVAAAPTKADTEGAPMAADNNIAVIETSMGTIKVQLAEKEAPNTVKNFKTLVEKKFYDGTVFHRVAAGFVIQGGGYDPEYKNRGEKEKVARIKMEKNQNLRHSEGVIAMARTGESWDTATCQFYITVAPAPMLDNPQNPYAVFGKVIEGMDVVKKIEAVPVGPGMIEIQGMMRPADNVPKTPVIISRISLQAQP